MDRPVPRYGYLAAFLTVAMIVIAAGGCQGALATLMYLTKGTDTPAEYDGLREKRVAVVCRPLVNLKYRNSGAARDLARELSVLLGKRVPKVEMIEQRKVAEWIDENGQWDDCLEVGKALDADMVVAVDLHGFSIYENQTLYQGKATVAVRVYDCSVPGEPVFQREPPQTVYPPNSVIPRADRPEKEFRREFVEVMADQIGRYFYAHDRYADYAMDAKAADM